MQLTSVDLPEPFGPISPSRSPLCDFEIDAVERDEAAKALADIVDLEKRRGHGVFTAGLRGLGFVGFAVLRPKN